MLGDVDDQAEIRANHLFACLRVVVVDDAASQGFFLVAVQQRGFVDLTQVQLQSGLDGNSSHKFSFPPTGATSKPQVRTKMRADDQTSPFSCVCGGRYSITGS